MGKGFHDAILAGGKLLDVALQPVHGTVGRRYCLRRGGVLNIKTHEEPTHLPFSVQFCHGLDGTALTHFPRENATSRTAARPSQLVNEADLEDDTMEWLDSTRAEWWDEE